MVYCYYYVFLLVWKWGGSVDDYFLLYQWFDQLKVIFVDLWYCVFWYYVEGIFMLEMIFGEIFINVDGWMVLVCLIGEQYVCEDFGLIFFFVDWVCFIMLQVWMLCGYFLDGIGGVMIDMFFFGDFVVLSFLLFVGVMVWIMIQEGVCWQKVLGDCLFG